MAGMRDRSVPVGLAERHASGRRLEIVSEAAFEDPDQPFFTKLDEVRRASNEMGIAAQNLDYVAILVEAEELVRDQWKAPWPWVSHDIVRHWFDCVVGSAYGLTPARVFAVQVDDDPPAPHFEIMAGERLSEARERFAAEMAAAAERPPKGRKPDETVISRYVGWWYRNRIRCEPILSIAGGDYDGRSLVRHGIRRAEGWLGAAAYVWSDGTNAAPVGTE